MTISFCLPTSIYSWTFRSIVFGNGALCRTVCLFLCHALAKGLLIRWLILNYCYLYLFFWSSSQLIMELSQGRPASGMKRSHGRLSSELARWSPSSPEFSEGSSCFGLCRILVCWGSSLVYSKTLCCWCEWRRSLQKWDEQISNPRRYGLSHKLADIFSENPESQVKYPFF